jgi:hypothetical protein
VAGAAVLLAAEMSQGSKPLARAGSALVAEGNKQHGFAACSSGQLVLSEECVSRSNGAYGYNANGAGSVLTLGDGRKHVATRKIRRAALSHPDCLGVMHAWYT